MFRFPSPFSKVKGHKGTKSPKRVQEVRNLENEHTDDVCHHAILKSWKLALFITYIMKSLPKDPAIYIKKTDGTKHNEVS